VEEVAEVKRALGRLAQRAWLLSNMTLLLAEAVYHRAHQKEENSPGLLLWRWGEEEGSLSLVATD
jgi:hypothetical protein